MTVVAVLLPLLVLLLLAGEADAASERLLLPLLLAREAGSCLPELAGLGAGLFQRSGQVGTTFTKH